MVLDVEGMAVLLKKVNTLVMDKQVSHDTAYDGRELKSMARAAGADQNPFIIGVTPV